MRNMMRPDTAQLEKIERCLSSRYRVRFCIPTRKVRPIPSFLIDMSDRLELVRNAVSFLTDPKVIYASPPLSSCRLIVWSRLKLRL
jgi:hypothetical protein